MKQLPLRVDFAGGWLDVPRFAIPGAHIINCAISPLVSYIYHPVIGKDGVIEATKVMSWPYPIPPGSGLGTSAAWHMLRGDNVRESEAAAGCGWQDEAVIRETGLCVWASGAEPLLVHRSSGDWLKGLMALHWTGKSHRTADVVNIPRSLNTIENAGVLGCKAAMRCDVGLLASAIDMSYEAQIGEGMEKLPVLGLAGKYCGAGWGGYAVYLFESTELRDAAVMEKGMAPVEMYANDCRRCDGTGLMLEVSPSRMSAAALNDLAACESFRCVACGGSGRMQL